MKISKLLLATIGATVLLGAHVSSAPARNISVSSQFLETRFRRVTFESPVNMVCEVHLSGSLHGRTLAKRVGSLIGYITQASLPGCLGGRATILRETLPWHVRFQDFTGTLPNITSLTTHVIRAAFQIMQLFFTCLATSTEAAPTVVIFNREVATRTLTTATISGTISTTCGFAFTLRSDEAPVTVLNSTSRITVTLI
jgi:hypothetical protein